MKDEKEKSQSNMINITLKASEKTGEFWGTILSKIVNFGADYINISYDCYKASSESFKKHSEPALSNAINKVKDNYNKHNSQVIKEKFKK